MSVVAVPSAEKREYLMLQEIVEAGRAALAEVVDAMASISEERLTLAREACEAVQEIRTKQLWRQQYPTFAAYCQVEVGLSDSRVRQIGSWLRTLKEMEGVTRGDIGNVTERQARELNRLDTPEEQVEVFEEAAAEGNASAGRLREKVEERQFAKAELDGLTGSQKVARIEARSQEIRVERGQAVNRSLLKAVCKHLRIALDAVRKLDPSAEALASEVEELQKKDLAAITKAEMITEGLDRLLSSPVE